VVKKLGESNQQSGSERGEKAKGNFGRGRRSATIHAAEFFEIKGGSTGKHGRGFEQLRGDKREMGTGEPATTWGGGRRGLRSWSEIPKYSLES